MFFKAKFESSVIEFKESQILRQGRVHTSATVAVLPEAEDVDIKIDDNDQE